MFRKFKRGLSFLAIGLATIILERIVGFLEPILINAVTEIWNVSLLWIVELIALGLMGIGVFTILQEKYGWFKKKNVSKNVKQNSSFETNMRTARKLSKVFNPQPIIHNKTFYCGCQAKDTIMVKLCDNHRQQYTVMNYEPPEGHYISEDHSLL